MNRFRKTLRGKFIGITVILMLVLGMGTATFSYVMLSENLEANLIHTAETNLQFLSNEISMNLSEIKDLSMWSRTNQDILNYIMTSPEEPDYATLTNKAYDSLTEEVLTNAARPYISRIVIANASNMKYLQKLSGTQYSTDQNMAEIIRGLPYYKELMDAPNYVFTIGLQKSPFGEQEESMLPIIRPIAHPYESGIVGISFLQISHRLFTDPLSSFSAREGIPLYLRAADRLYRIDGGKITEIPLDSEVEQVGTSLAAGANIQVQRLKREKGGTEKLVTVYLEDGEFSVSLPVDSSTESMVRSGFIAVLFVILLIVAAIGGILYAFLSHTVTAPVEALKEQIDTIGRGDFSQNPRIEWDDEFGEIGRNINKQAVAIEMLMEQRVSLERQQRDYEYKMLQSQINPHFLYNTLNSIKWMAVAQRTTGIPEMTTALSHLLKNISKGDSTIICLEDELHFLDDYFTIQKYRYGGTITMEYRIEEEALRKVKILRFTLQPIVENAIFHGIEPKGQEGHIDVHIFRNREDDLQIDVTDDGIGMDEQTIEQVLHAENGSSSNFFRQVGIGNVNKRIKYSFGEKYGISIESRQGEYTRVSVIFPAGEEEGNETGYRR